jgi:glycosyltransferase involved in cell wall biosynthesis
LDICEASGEGVLNILLMYGRYLPAGAAGGPVFLIRSLGRELASRGHTITLYTSTLGNTPEERLAARTFVDYRDGMRVVYVRAVTHYRFNPVSPALIPLFRRELGKFDVVQIFGHRQFPNLLASWFAQRLGVPSVLHAVGGLPYYMVRSVGRKKLYDALFTASLIRRTARVIASTRQEGSEMVRFGVPEEKIVVIPDPLDLSDFQVLPVRGAFRRQHGVGQSTALVLYLGRIERKKNLHLLVEGFAKARLAEAMLFIVGPANDQQDYLDSLKRLGHTLGIAKQLRFVDYLAGREKVQAFVDADIFVNPSRTENYGFAILESIAAGTPVVVTETCGAVEYMDEGTGLVISDPGELSSALQSLLTNEVLLCEMRERCRAARAKLLQSAANSAEQYERVYREVGAGMQSQCAK